MVTAEQITALGALLALLGAGVRWLVLRMEKWLDRREKLFAQQQQALDDAQERYRTHLINENHLADERLEAFRQTTDNITNLVQRLIVTVNQQTEAIQALSLNFLRYSISLEAVHHLRGHEIFIPDSEMPEGNQP